MVQIEIKINNKVIRKHKVVNITEYYDHGKYGIGEQLYEIDGDILIKHNYEDGLDSLVKLVIDTIGLK